VRWLHHRGVRSQHETVPEGSGWCVMSEDTDPRWPADSPPDELIEAAAEVHDVDLDHAVVGFDADPESSRIYIIEEADGGYRLISFGLMAEYPEEGQPASEEPIFIPETAVGAVQGLLHAAGLHVSNREFVPGPEEDQQISIRDLAEGMGVSEPLRSGEGDPA